MTWWQVVIAVIGAVLTPLLTYLAAKTSARIGAKTAQTADWEAFSREQREWTEDRLAERDQKITNLAQEVAEIRSELDGLRGKYRMAIAYVRRLATQLRQHVPPDEIEPPPPEISPDI